MLDDHFLILPCHSDILANDCIGAKPQRQSNDETDRHLPYNFVQALQTLLVLAENLDVVVHKTKEAQPYSRANHQQQIGITHTPQ